MAKLFNIEGKNADIIKGIFLFVGVASFIIIALLRYDGTGDKNEDPSEYYVGIHVKGAVENPGFYEVPFGTRVRDLDKYAGDFDERVDFDGINLAEYVHDGQEVFFPYKGSAETGAKNLNTVTFEELIEMPGIGETTAREIIAYRDKNGRFEKVIELKTVLGNSKYNDLRESFYVE